MAWSNWQEGIDIDAALSKLDMVIFKASDGTGFVDKQCAGWVKAARKAGKPFGVYHFFCGRGIAEADHFLRVCKDWVGRGVLILDVETEECSKVEVMAFVKRVHAKTGVWPWVYTSASFVSRFMNDYVKAHCGLWCAGYPTQPATWTKREFPYGGYTQAARWGDIYLSEANHTAMCTSDDPDMLCQFSISENGTIYGAQGDQTGNESNFGPYYDYPWDGRLEWIDREDTGGSEPVVTDDIDKLAHDVINGVLGNGDARRAALGGKYDAVQARVNEILGGGGSGGGAGVDVDDLARRVIVGEFGNGQARKGALGVNYEAVQMRVIQMLS